jgi:hypothetical protein
MTTLSLVDQILRRMELGEVEKIQADVSKPIVVTALRRPDIKEPVL